MDRSILGNSFHGTHRLESVRQWSHPIAWQGTVDAEHRAAYEAAVRDLQQEALTAIREADGGYGVEVGADAQIVAVLTNA